jgi:hypothetical protein
MSELMRLLRVARGRRTSNRARCCSSWTIRICCWSATWARTKWPHSSPSEQLHPPVASAAQRAVSHAAPAPSWSTRARPRSLWSTRWSRSVQVTRSSSNHAHSSWCAIHNLRLACAARRTRCSVASRTLARWSVCIFRLASLLGAATSASLPAVLIWCLRAD